MEDESDSVRQAALQAASNVPVRSRRKGIAGSPGLKSFSEVPNYLKDNEYIHHYYRSDYSVGDGVKSLLYVHNETGNVWTHLLGFLLFLGLTIHVIWATPTQMKSPLAFGREHLSTLQTGFHDSLHHVRDNVHALKDQLQDNFHSLQDHAKHNLLSLQSTLHSKTQALHLSMDALHGGVSSLQDNIHSKASSFSSSLHDNLHHVQESLQNMRTLINGHMEDNPDGTHHWQAERWPVYVFLVAAMLCLLTSSMCHLFSCCSLHTAKFMWRLDYTGIVVLIVASFFPPVYFGFQCAPYWRTFYLATTSTMGMAVAVVSLAPYFQQPKFRPFRATLFSALGAWGIVPLLHAWYVNRGSAPFQAAVYYDLFMGACYLSGALVYAMRVPERWRPGAFDLAFHSHQIFHLAVIVAAIAHFKAVMIMLEWRDAGGACPVAGAGKAVPDLHSLASDLGALEQVWESFKHQIQRHTEL